MMIRVRRCRLRRPLRSVQVSVSMVGTQMPEALALRMRRVMTTRCLPMMVMLTRCSPNGIRLATPMSLVVQPLTATALCKMGQLSNLTSRSAQVSGSSSRMTISWLSWRRLRLRAHRSTSLLVFLRRALTPHRSALAVSCLRLRSIDRTPRI